MEGTITVGGGSLEGATTPVEPAPVESAGEPAQTGGQTGGSEPAQEPAQLADLAMPQSQYPM